jgi:hypothetical protein
MLRFIIGLFLLLCLTACNSGDVSGSTLKQAIGLQLQHTQQELSRQLGLAEPGFQVQSIKVVQETPITIDRLPGYKVQGLYNVALQFPHRQVFQKDNPFSIYLQQQIEGETWRLFIPEAGDSPDEQVWTSYLIE